MARKLRSARLEKSKLLTSFRRIEDGAPSESGFGRTLGLSENDALLESAEAFPVGQVLALEFLLDDNRVARVEGTVTRVAKTKGFYHSSIEFQKVDPKDRRLLAKHLGS